jgi:hypothetical protein
MGEEKYTKYMKALAVVGALMILFVLYKRM